MNPLFLFKQKISIGYLFLLIEIFSLAALKARPMEDRWNTKQEFIETTLVDRDSLVAFAKSLKGEKYCYGSCKPGKGFDCSGFVYYVFSQFGITLPRSSPLMAEAGKEIDLEDCEKGDLLFFTGTNSEDRTVGHVGIVVSEQGEPIEFIHSSSGKSNSVVITALSTPHYKKRFLKVKRVL